MTTTSTSLLQTALQNLHTSQQFQNQSHTPRPPSSRGDRTPPPRTSTSSRGESDSDFDEDDQELVKVGKDTAPSTPLPGQKGLVLGQKVPGALSGKSKDPLRTLPTHVAVRIFLQLDVKALARCDRVCKRWHKSSTLNYVWFLQNRALVLPHLAALNPSTNGKVRKTGADTPEFFDPYDKTPRLSSLPQPRLPTSTTPQWTKAESKKVWKTTFHTTLKRSDPNAEPEDDPLRVSIDSLQSSGYSTPNGGRHSYAGLGAGNAARWDEENAAAGGSLTPGERKVAAREGYKSLGGRKARSKRKMGGEMGMRDKGGAVDDGRFDAPW